MHHKRASKTLKKHRNMKNTCRKIEEVEKFLGWLCHVFGMIMAWLFGPFGPYGPFDPMALWTLWPFGPYGPLDPLALCWTHTRGGRLMMNTSREDDEY